MNKLLIGALAVILLVGGTITAFTQARSNPGQVIVPTIVVSKTQGTLPANPNIPGGQALPSLLNDSPAVVEAKVMPPRSFNLRFEITGTVAEVMVQEGATVAKGDILARLDTRALELEIAAAEAELAQYRANYNAQRAGFTPAEIEQARARVSKAEADLNQTQKTVSEQDVIAAKAQIEALKIKIKTLEATPESPEIDVARAMLDEAKLLLQSDRDTLSAKKTVLEAQMQQAANKLRDMQDTYARIKDENAKASNLTQEDIDAEAFALRAMQNADQDFQAAKVLLDEARKVETSTLQASEARVRVAQATLNRVMDSQQPDQIAEARAQLAQAEATLFKLEAEYRSAYERVSQAEVEVAKADLARVEATPRPVDLAGAEAAIKRAEVELMQRRFALEAMTLRAPAAGTLASLEIDVGQVITSEQIVGTLADLSSWQMRTVDLSELNIVGLEEGDPVMISFYAIPGLELPGKISHIQTIGQSVPGIDTTYSLVITPDTQDSRLRWNMTAAVRILPKK